jgi:hypothetical protein
MSKRTRWYVLLATAPLVAIALGRIADDLSDAALRGAVVGVFVLVVFIGMPWLEMAHDGALRRQPRR